MALSGTVSSVFPRAVVVVHGLCKSYRRMDKGKILHTRNQDLRNHREFSVAFSNGLSVSFSNINSLSSCMFQRIVTCPVDFHWNCPMDCQWHFPMDVHSCDVWCVIFCPDCQAEGVAQVEDVANLSRYTWSSYTKHIHMKHVTPHPHRKYRRRSRAEGNAQVEDVATAMPGSTPMKRKKGEKMRPLYSLVVLICCMFVSVMFARYVIVCLWFNFRRARR